MRLKSLVSGLLTVALVFSFVPAYAMASDVGVLQSKTFTQNQDLYTSDGQLLGTEHRILTVNLRQVNNGVEASVTENNDYQLKPEFASIPEYQETFSDGSKTKTFFVTNDNRVYVNGKFLAKNDDIFDFFVRKRVRRDSGGVPSLCHYYDDGRYQNYRFNCYSTIDWSWKYGASPSGGRVSKVIRRGSPFFDSAKSAVDSFQSNLNTTAIAFKFFVLNLVAEGYAASTLNIPAIIIGGGGLAAEAIAIYNYFDNAKSDIEDAYGYINAA